MDKPHAAEMTPVLSSHILAVGHDPAQGLIVAFADGATVAYPNVSADTASEIAKAASPGAALHALVKSQQPAHRYLTAPLRVPRRKR